MDIHVNEALNAKGIKLLDSGLVKRKEVHLDIGTTAASLLVTVVFQKDLIIHGKFFPKLKYQPFLILNLLRTSRGFQNI